MVDITELVTSEVLTSRRLQFSETGGFKILQITDTHLDFLKEREGSESVLKEVRVLLKLEKPDLVIVTGDMIFKTREEEERLSDVFASEDCSYAYTLGNHDYDIGQQPLQRIQENMQRKPWSLTQMGPSHISGITNYILPIYSSSSSSSVAAYLWLLDTNSYIEGFDHGFIENVEYAGVDASQLEWMKRTRAEWASSDDHRGVQQLCFFHIPPPEYTALLADKAAWVGHQGEPACVSRDNSGFFQACKDVGIGHLACGHDHVNSLVGGLDGLTLSYGRKLGPLCYSDETQCGSGGRVFVLDRVAGTTTTYVRMVSGLCEEDTRREP
eukprot:GCRY01000323.1.p1 GENE.GCRY01000323.1~~GCRY01000323.1.p1  ORF type:complete len:326 (+),score=80.03 GCRY01000323.1:231-1208(+)